MLLPRMLFLLVFLFMLPGNCLGIEKLTDSEMSSVHAKNGLSISFQDVTMVGKMDNVRFSSVDNQDLFGNYIYVEGFIGLEKADTVMDVNGTLILDVGTYEAPDEHYTVQDRCKDNVALFGSMDLEWYHPNSILPHNTAYDWIISDDMPRPMDGEYAAVKVVVDDFSSSFDMKSQVNFSDVVKMEMGASNVSMPDFQLNGRNMPGMDMTIMPLNGCEPAFEMRTRLEIGSIGFSEHVDTSLYDPATNPAPEPGTSLNLQGIRFAESFSSSLPSHTDDTGTVAIDTSLWGNDIESKMYSGYFVIGNMNQVDFADLVGGGEYTAALEEDNADRQLKDGKFGSDDPPEENGELVGLVAKPTTLNVGTDGDRSYILISSSLHGSIRVASLTTNADAGEVPLDLGPIAVDGLRVKHVTIEFPGQHTRVDPGNGETYMKGRVPPEQYNYIFGEN